MPIEEELRGYIQAQILKDARAELDREQALVGSGLLDSLGLMQLITHVQQQWKVDLLSSASPEDLVSIATMARLIRKHVPE